MQEVVLFLSSIAGACTAIAIKNFPRNKVDTKTINVNSQIKSQINSLHLEKEILTKTITRLYQNNAAAGLNKIQQDKLLLRYQHQLGIILAKIEKLEAANKHPDLGSIGEDLIALIDQKLSRLDNRLDEMSSKITIANSQIPEIKKVIEQKEKPVTKLQEKPIIVKRDEKPQPKVIVPAIHVVPQLSKSVELTTLTEISNKSPEFPFAEQKPQSEKEIIKGAVKQQEKVLPKKEVKTIQTTAIKPKIEPEATKHKISTQLLTPQSTTQVEHEKLQLSPTILHDNDYSEDDEDDLDKIKGDIIKTLSRLEQAEVE